MIKEINKHYQILLVFICGLVLRLYMTIIDPFLHSWDERYHALVAKNMIRFPFKPMLTVSPITKYDANVWCCNHIWLHKQPLFMWQMALSMKIFGVNEFALRLPSAIMGSLMILMVYRICILLTQNVTTALIASLLMCFSNYQLELISGRLGMDHNDVAFGFYVLASIWAYSEYGNNSSKKWAVLIGFFVAAAILNKWLTGLLVFAPWFIKMLYDYLNFGNKKQMVHFVLALLVCLVVALPWQLYILYKFPEQAKYEFAYNSKHIWEVVEGHWGDKWYYLDRFSLYFGASIKYFLFLGMIVYWIKSKTNQVLYISLLSMFCLVFIFFTFIVASKLPTYFFVVAPIGFIFISIGVNSVIAFLFEKNKILSFALIGFCIYKSINLKDIILSRKNNAEREVRINNTNIYKKLKEVLPPNYKVVINVNEFEHPDVMFYNDGISAYHWCFSEDEIKQLEKKNVPIAAFDNHANYELPDYIKSYKNLFIIKSKLK